jgi:hypothetical protein
LHATDHSKTTFDIICAALQGIADAGEKLRLLQSLNLTDVLQQLPPASLDDEVAAKLAELVNSFATQLLSLWDDVYTYNNNSSSSSSSGSSSSGNTNSEAAQAAQAAAVMLSAVVPLLWQYLSHSDVTVTQSVIPATTRLVQVLKKELSPPAAKPGNKTVGGSTVTADVAAAGSSSTSTNGASQQLLFSAAAHAPQLLTVVYARMQYPDDFSFDATDEDEGEEDQLRSALRKVLVNVCRACPDMVLQFLCSALQALPSPLSALPWPAAEAALRLLYHFSEGCAGETCYT